MSRSFPYSEADRLAESIALHQQIVAQLVVERERIDQSLAYYQAELNWLDRCKAFLAGSDNRHPPGQGANRPDAMEPGRSESAAA